LGSASDTKSKPPEPAKRLENKLDAFRTQFSTLGELFLLKKPSGAKEKDQQVMTTETHQGARLKGYVRPWQISFTMGEENTRKKVTWRDLQMRVKERSQ